MSQILPLLCIQKVLIGLVWQCPQWGRRLERWPNTEARLAGWRRVTKPRGVCVVMDGPCRLPFSSAWPGLELLSCELLANPAAVSDVLVLIVHKILSWALSRKAGIKTLVTVDPAVSLSAPSSPQIYSTVFHAILCLPKVNVFYTVPCMASIYRMYIVRSACKLRARRTVCKSVFFSIDINCWRKIGAYLA